MPKVLIVAYSYPPINSPAALRVAGFVRHLPAFGWDPVVLTVAGGWGRGFDLPVPAGVEEWRVPDPDPIKALAHPGPARPERQLPAWRGPVDHWLRAAYRAVLFPDRDILWALRAARYGAHCLQQRPDIRLVVSSASGASKHWAAAAMARQAGRAWIPVCHDPWAGDTMTDRPRSRLRAWAERRLETGLLRQAAQVVAVSAGSIPRLCCPPDRVCSIPGGLDPEDYQDLPSSPQALPRAATAAPDAPAAASGPFRIAHAGTLYGGRRDPSGLFRALRLLLDQGRLVDGQVEILLIGREEPGVTALAANVGVAHLVSWTGYVSHRRSLELMAGSHLLAAVTTAGGYELPRKFFEYLGVGRPILALWPRDAELSDLVRRARAGHVCDPDNVDGIATHLLARIGAWQSGTPLPVPDPAVVDSLTYRAAAGRLAEILNRHGGV